MKPDLSRRNFLKNLATVGTVSLLPNILTGAMATTTTTQRRTQSTLDTPAAPATVEKPLTDAERYQKSLQAIGQNEMDYFMDWYGIKREADNLPSRFVGVVRTVQSSLGIKADGLMGAGTLRTIYREIYAKQSQALDERRKNRLQTDQEMSGYSRVRRARAGRLNTYRYETYYGSGVRENTDGRFISADLVGKVPEQIPEGGNKIMLSQVGEDTVVSFYIDGKLHLATITSLGRGRRTPRREFVGEVAPDMLHYSSKYHGAVMPYAVHVSGAIWIHGSDGVINGDPASHGCIRIPLLYARELHNRVLEIGHQNITIDTRQAY